ncbi:hypothetical protein FHQ18_09945 [Deferribacter autotrophicus]|uniref:Type II secretion system protein n=1 Tax=Deferribacter autotrophicus TaxID=500465 RepID=A0A5A8F126_9BACT|nr:prepilin-type N-terminal cleavage/methylation domain-containing protein [Deferribacter autotrophicus]KAA0257359.1 hypothetical protein FHQ18_09945 [Deferribacter autotrophicus]
MNKNCKKGFTLIEIVIFIVVFTIGVMGIMMLFYNVLGKTSDPTVRHKGVQIAQTVMEVIVAKKFDEDTPNGGGTIDKSLINIGSETGETISKYDDVDDYVDNCDEEKQWQPSDFGLSGNFEIYVTVYYIDIDNDGNIVKSECTTPTNYKLIKVRVHNSAINEDYTSTHIKGNF